MREVIKIRGLDFFYGDGDLRCHVLKNLDLTINQGELVIMTGPSGSGKTTLLTIIGALRSVHHGYIDILGRSLVGGSDQVRDVTRLDIGYIFQQHNLLSSLTAVQNVAMSLELRSGYSESQRLALATEILAKVGLETKVNSMPNELSGGQKQRVSIARALVASPKIILADEPTASLDKASGQEAVEILKALAKQDNTTILLVTHDYRILDIADRIVHLEDGYIRVTA